MNKLTMSSSFFFGKKKKKTQHKKTPQSMNLNVKGNDNAGKCFIVSLLYLFATGIVLLISFLRTPEGLKRTQVSLESSAV